MKLLDLIDRKSIIPNLASLDRNGVVRELVEVLVRARLLSEAAVEGIVRSIITRERTRGTTGFGKGVAVPHVKVEVLPRIVAAVGRSDRGVDFGSLDGQPVYSVFLIVSPADQPEEHLRAMDLIFRHLQQEQFRKFLRQADTTDKIHDLLVEADEKSPAA